MKFSSETVFMDGNSVLAFNGLLQCYCHDDFAESFGAHECIQVRKLSLYSSSAGQAESVHSSNITNC